MPNFIDLFPGNYSVTNNPLNTLNIDPSGFVGDVNEFANLAEDIALAILNSLIDLINSVLGTLGLPLLPQAQVILADAFTFLDRFGFGTDIEEFSLISQLVRAFGGDVVTGSLSDLEGIFGGLGNLLASPPGLIVDFVTGQFDDLLSQLTIPNLIGDEVGGVTGLADVLNTGIPAGIKALEDLTTLLANLELSSVTEFSNLIDGILTGNDLTWLQELLTSLGFDAVSELTSFLQGVDTFITDLVSGLGATSTTTAVTTLTGAVTDASNAQSFLSQLQTDLSTGNFAGSATLLAGNVTGVQSLITAVGASSIGELGTLLGDTTSFYESLLTAAGASNASALSSVVSTAVTDAQAFAAFEADLLSNVGGANLSVVSTTLGTAVNAGVQFTDALTGLDLSSGSGLATLISGFETLLSGFSPSSVLSQLIALFPGAESGLSGLSGLGGIFGDLVGFVGSPTGLGSGHPASATAVSSIPVLSGLFSSGKLLTTLIPDLSADLITSGTLAAGLVSGALSDVTLAGSDITGTIAAGLISGALSGATLAGSSLTGSVAASLISGTTAVEQDIINFINAALGQPTGGVVATVETALQSIPNANVLGQLTATIGSDITGIANAVGSVIGGILGIGGGGSTAQVSSAAAAVTNVATNANTIAEQIAATIQAQSTNNPISIGINPSAFAAVFPISNLTATSPPTISVTSTASAIGTLTTPNGGVAESIRLYGQIVGSLSSIVLNVYQISTSTGAETLVWSSANVVGDIASALGDATYINIPSADFITTVQGDFYAVELQVVGTGSFELVGISGHWALADTTVFPASMGQTRGPVAPTFNAEASPTTQGASPRSWTHPIAATATAILIGVTEAGSTVPTVTVGGVAATQLEDVVFTSSGMFVYGLILTGAAASLAGTTPTIVATGSGDLFAAGSVSYIGVSGFGIPVTATGSGTAAAQSIAGTANEIVFQALSDSATGSFSGYSENSRVNKAAASGVNTALLIGDFTGSASSITGSAGFSVTGTWGSIMVPILGAVPAAPTTISTPIFSNNIPWFAFCGSAGVSAHAPVPAEFTTPGTFTYDVPEFMIAGDLFDIVVLSDGGGGGFINGGIAFGGGAGSFTAITLEYGTNIPLSATSFTVTVGPGGAGGASGLTSNAGSNGSGCSVVITGHGTISSPGGTGGAATATVSAGNGQAVSPDPEVFNGASYFGGGEQTASAVGISPGGGGFGHGFAGAPGAVFITAYQPPT